MKSSESVKEFFRAHWTVRRYREVAMPAEHLDAILFAAQRAPTDATAQMYSLVRLTDPELRRRIASLAGNEHIGTASESFVVCADIHRLGEILRSRGFVLGHFPHIAVHFGIGDAVLAGQNLLIAAEMLGYRGCWIGGVLSALAEISRELVLPKGVVPFAALTIGVPDESPQERPRLARPLVIHENRYRSAPSEELLASVEVMNAITPLKDWAELLRRYFGQGGSMERRDPSLAAFLENSFG